MGRKNQTNKQNYQQTPLAGKDVIELGTFFSYRRNINLRLIQVTSRIKQSQQREENQ